MHDTAAYPLPLALRAAQLSAFLFHFVLFLSRHKAFRCTYGRQWGGILPAESIGELHGEDDTKQYHIPKGQGAAFVVSFPLWLCRHTLCRHHSFEGSGRDHCPFVIICLPHACLRLHGIRRAFSPNPNPLQGMPPCRQCPLMGEDAFLSGSIARRESSG